jgi:short-subunit dehydrogenase
MKRIILITGCSQGLGKYLAESLASHGHRVYAGVRKVEDVKLLEAQKTEKNLTFIQLDVTRNEECLGAVARILREEKRIDVLINNAGNTLSGPITDFSDQDFSNLLDVNTVGAFRLITAVIPVMKHKEGKIINITSLNGLLALPYFSIYSASKFALQSLGNALYYELAKEKIHITSLSPGAIKHPHNKGKPLSHTPAREKFLVLKILMPLVSYEKILTTISDIIEKKSPPREVTLGNDAKITVLLQRFLPNTLWESLMLYIWKK